MSVGERRWLELGVRSSGDAEHASLLAEGLLGLGGRAVEERLGWLVTDVPMPRDPDAWLRGARELLAHASGLDALEIVTRDVPEEDWAEVWKRGLAPRRITPRLTVTPSWRHVEAGPDELVLTVDPGMAFGTAEHGTTRGCLRLLDGTVTRGAHVLDVGAGSGILSIAAALMGAAKVVAVEGDELAIEVISENVRLNGVDDVVTCEPSWADVALLASLGPVDGVVANIESLTLMKLLPGFHAALAPRGWLILSGILDVEWAPVRDAAEGVGFRTEALDEDGEWRSARFARST
ncbi:MAG: 50S ribosomal protein L11 methyltransferase [Gemmatimonadetes bacterium]|nr:50S ribosomal protein L11 methyltransferase [Gemmatimonadota bacterium]